MPNMETTPGRTWRSRILLSSGPTGCVGGLPKTGSQQRTSYLCLTAWVSAQQKPGTAHRSIHSRRSHLLEQGKGYISGNTAARQRDNCYWFYLLGVQVLQWWGAVKNLKKTDGEVLLVQLPAYIWVLTKADQMRGLFHFLLILKQAAVFQVLILYMRYLPMSLTSTHFTHFSMACETTVGRVQQRCW